jgi:NADH-quinone oxidoreductase subunit L
VIGDNERSAVTRKQGTVNRMTHPIGPNPSVIAAAVAALTPFAAFLVIFIITRRRPRISAALSIFAATLSLFATIFLLAYHWKTGDATIFSVRWMVSGDLQVPFAFLLDPISLLMATVVAAICFLVQIYSLGYMAGDPGFSRYYAFMSLFVGAMLSLVMSATLIQLYIFWELVGLCSYFLIGFWYEKFSASAAGKKAFVMTRLGDVSFFLGILLILIHVGNSDISALNREAGALSPLWTTVAGLLIFGGIVGKSAQFPLLTWLPDAMQGPTPVSALLHSATMVAAGVYLFARLLPFFSQSDVAMNVMLSIGTISMLIAATMAMVSRDLKRIWAYSTISQMGFMIMALAAGSRFAGLFHLTTHAGFKALLFLCSGVWIYRFETNDIFDIGRRGGRKQTTVLVCMLFGALSLAGIPPLGGFFSKERIIADLAAHAHPLWTSAALLGVFMTAYYVFRTVFVIWMPKAAAENRSKIHTRNQRPMAWTLFILAAVTAVIGFFQTALEAFLSTRATGHNPWLSFISVALAGAGLALAWFEFGRRRAGQIGFVERVAPMKTLFAQRWYIDHFYHRLVDLVVDRGLAPLCGFGDAHVVDGGIHCLGRGTVQSGKILSRLHVRMIQHRLLAIFVIIVLLALYFFAD